MTAALKSHHVSNSKVAATYTTCGRRIPGEIIYY
jgi:hypothetical protein